LYIAIDSIPEFSACEPLQAMCGQEAFQNVLLGLRATEAVMYEAVAALKFAALRMLYEHFCKEHLRAGSERGRQFGEFIQSGGESLRLHAIFEALDARFRLESPPLSGWRQWPMEYASPRSTAVQDFAAAQRYDIEFHIYLQWLAATQLKQTQDHARERGMRIGLYGDLAVGANPGGSEVWSNQDLFVTAAGIGAPPDPLALSGQDWGIPPVDPMAMRLQSFTPFDELLRANMNHVGAVRVDHVMSLFRLWWVPRGFGATEGVYVHYPLQELVSRLADASQQARCLVVGEDLGTVPDEVRYAMARYRLYHYKVLLFEKQGDRFKAPTEYVREAVATASTHDLPPLRAWWQGDDLRLRDDLELYPSADTAAQLHAERTTDRVALLRALREQGLWHWVEGEPLPEYSLALTRAMHLYLGLSNAALVLVQLEDLMEMTDPVNVPGTHTEHANWQRKLTQPVEAVLAREEIKEALLALGRARQGINPNR
jgi:4-alpha-glucanotransferase